MLTSTIDLSSGQVVEPLPEAARQALAGSDALTAYASPAGQEDLRAAVAELYRRRGSHEVSADAVTVTAGGRHGLLVALAATAAGGEVLVPRPHWSHYPKVARLAGAEPVFVPGDEQAGWLVDPDRLARARTPRTRAMVINSPVNPTGAAYDADALAAIRRWAAAEDVTLIVDDIYWAYGHQLPVQAGPHEVVVGGAAKVHALAGLRIGWIFSAGQLTTTVRDMVEHTTGPVSTLAQTAVAATLAAEDEVRDRVSRIAVLRNVAMMAFSTVPLVRPVRPDGGIYVCLDVTEPLRRKVHGAGDDVAFCQVLAEHTGVRLRAGSTFGLPGHVRLCVAAPPMLLRAAAERLTRFLSAGHAGDVTDAGGTHDDHRTEQTGQADRAGTSCDGAA